VYAAKAQQVYAPNNPCSSRNRHCKRAVVVLKRLCALNSERAHSTALMVMLPLSIISVAVYMLRNMLIVQSALPVILGMLPGSFFGARLLGKLRPLWIDSLFCLLMLAAGIRLLL